ncbi:MAG: FK506-binding protein, partial [Cyanobacteriota bacterium]
MDFLGFKNRPVSTKPAGQIDPLKEGLIIEDKKIGEGVPVSSNSILLLHYVGRLASDGTEFDSSRKRGEPILLQLGQGNLISG